MTRDQIAAYIGQHFAGDDVALILAVIEEESSFEPRAFRADRNGGSFGLMQLDVPTARDRGFTGAPDALYDPATNIRFGVAQLNWIADYLKSRSAYSVGSVIAGYNEGVGNVMRGNPDPRYVARVTEFRRQWQLRLAGAVQ
ncbi:MAG TPA: transglycosylase SLT domain-containing protein [Stellaceae bacterium]|nr:transglycosylase SLT domain-containing protein [Stellaceae bacterium]